MEKIPRNQQAKRLNRQQKYRQAQESKGLVRFEIQLPANIKARFDALVEAIAEELQEPWDTRQRIALARIQVFEEITQGVTHDFTALTTEIAALKEEIKALSPTFFKSHANEQIPIPEAIRALDDNPEQLKQLITKLYQGLQATKLSAHEYKRSASQFEALYEASSRYNEELKQKLQYETTEEDM